MNKEKLYEAFGELVYVIAMTDGIIQPEEKDALKKIIANHPWANEIEWSFNYEVEKHQNIDYLYKRVLDLCHKNGPDPEYKFLVEVLEAVANASSDKVSEKEVIDRFTHDLTEKFKNDLDKIHKKEDE